MEEIAEVAETAGTIVTSTNDPKRVVVILGAATLGYLTGTAIVFGLRKYRQRNTNQEG
jgi:hypothetical protein